MIKKLVGVGTTASYEYGLQQQLTERYYFLVRRDEATDIKDAFEQISETFSNNYTRLNLTLQEEMTGEKAGYKIEAIAERLNYALREDNLYWSSRISASTSTEQTSLDYDKNVVTVTYGDAEQVVQYNQYVPVMSMSAMCIASANIITIAPWLGDNFFRRVNLTSFRGFGENNVMCSGITIEPFSVALKGKPDKYKFVFNFVIRDDGWFPWVYYIGSDGTPPPDLVLGEGYGKMDGIVLPRAYKKTEFNTLWPFTLPWTEVQQDDI